METRIVPSAFLVAPTNVVHSTFAILARPHDGEISIGAARAVRRTKLIRIEAHYDVDSITGVRLFENRVLLGELKWRDAERIGSW